jgi:NAD(P)-dependent dehydrogenase (short-subunit alcohol dehydrogenase family)
MVIMQSRSMQAPGRRMTIMKSKVALVTGASSGIGEATAERLAEAGYQVFGTSRRGVRAGKRAFELLSLDVTSDRSVEAAVEDVADIVLKAASAARPKVRYTAGGLAGRLRFLRTYMPAGLLDAGIRRDLRLDAITGPEVPRPMGSAPS